MHQNSVSAYNTPQLEKTSKAKPQFFKKANSPQDESRKNLSKLKINHKLNPHHRGHSYQLQDKNQKTPIDQLIKNSQPYKQLLAKMRRLEQQHSVEKQTIINSINSKNQTISQLKKQEEQLNKQKISLLQIQADLQQKLSEIREENERIRQYIEMCQNGELDMELLQYAINTDNMTYEELLQLQEKMGVVSKGFTEQQVLLIPQHQYSKETSDELCTICYYQFKKGEMTNIFGCKHTFHHDCISGWLLKERLCPMCKQEIQLPAEEYTE